MVADTIFALSPSNSTEHVQSMLAVQNLGFARNNKLLFENLSFELKSGEMLLIEGANGCGKSTLLRLLAGIATSAHGNIHWNGNCIASNHQQYKKNLHYLGHQNGIKLSLSVYENIQWMGALANLALDAIALHKILDALKLATVQSQMASTLSAGQKRRLGLAKLLLWQRYLWILDEPFTAVDTQTQRILCSHLETHLQHQGIAIVTSHQPIYLSEYMRSQHLRLGHA